MSKNHIEVSPGEYGINDKCIVAKSIIEKHTGTIEDINDFNLFVNILNNNGLCDKILKEQIIVNLQKSLDNICGYIGHEKINIINELLDRNNLVFDRVEYLV